MTADKPDSSPGRAMTEPTPALPLACQACGTARPEDKVRWRSLDMDLPALRMCQVCSVVLSMNPEMREELGL